MRNVWAAVLATWALFGVLALLAWTRPQPSANTPQSIPSAVIVKGKNGQAHLVVVKGGATSSSHATTRTSPVPAG